jgi:hypothetical protein
VTLVTVPDGAPQALVGDMASTAAPVPLREGSPCPSDGGDACGFTAAETAIVFDGTATFEGLVVERTEPGLLWALPRPLAKAYQTRDHPRVSSVRLVTYYHDGRRRQLRRAEGDRADVPIADDVVALEIRYLGDPLPPEEPRPPPGEESCVVDRAGLPRLPVLRPDRGALVELTETMLSDGPWCGVPPWRFDADLYRVRQLRVTLTLQAESPVVRGIDTSRFRNPGVAREAGVEVPDLVLRVVVSPRNLNAR